MKRVIAIALALCMTLCLLSGCGGNPAVSSGSAPGSASQSDAVSSEPASSGGEEPSGEVVDYAASVKLDMNSDTAKEEVTVKARTGYTVETYKVWYQNGKEVGRERLHTSQYKMYQQTIQYNDGYGGR